jgi:hypothetical protein
VTTPNPALVTERAARRLPRLALLLFCAAYILPGVFGRDPWKNADITALGYMMSLVRGDAISWMTPSIAGLPSDNGLLPYWLGALSIESLSGWISPLLAARLPFAALLALLLVFLWYATYHLARTEAAQPLAFAFGGEAQPTDYARAVADAALLALMASLGLLQPGHELTPEMLQLVALGLHLYGMAASPYRPVRSALATLVALPAMAASGAPTTAVLLALSGSLVTYRSSYPAARQHMRWILLAGVLSALLAGALNAWVWRIAVPDSGLGTLRLLAWFAWPVWPLAGWTLWRWRGHLLHRHIAVPLSCVLVALGSSIAMGASDRALMLAIPGLAVLGAFALPTLKRSVSAAIDWFSVFFFSICALTVWVIYLAIYTGWPAQPASNVARLAPELEVHFDPAALLLAALGTVAWLWLVRWRTGRHREALWKSLVLPAGGVALNWLLVMTLWLQVLDHARSYRPLVQRIALQVPSLDCIYARQFSRAQLAALEVLGQWTVETLADSHNCRWMLVNLPAQQQMATPSGWQFLSRIRRPTDREESILIYRRETAVPSNR